MKKFFIYIIIFTISFSVNAQSFYPQAGFVFYNSNNFSLSNYSPFTMPYTLPVQQEGYAQLNDSLCPNSPVIFSTNGINVYNGATGAIVATGLLGEGNSTNAATIVPIAGNRALIITTKAYTNPSNLAYSSIITYTGSCPSYTFTMPLATKNRQIIGLLPSDTSFTEKVTVLPIAGSNDYWLLMHEASNAALGSDKFIVFRIDYITGTPMAVANYFVGTKIRKVGGKGQMQAIPSQIASGPVYLIGAAYLLKPFSITGAVDVLIMNPSTGALTLKESISYSTGSSFRPYGLEFSRSGSFLYVAARNLAKSIKRYNPTVGAGTIFTTMQNSLFGGSIPGFRLGQLQRLDNDGIYTPLYLSNKLLNIANSSLATSFPFAPPAVTISNPSGGLFRWGLSNYWRH
jgi:hypothetical protein